MSVRDLLIEIGTEELPPKALTLLSSAFLHGVEQGLTDARLAFASIKPFATPRRLALLIDDLSEQQPDTEIERRGPALQAAFAEDGCPTKAAQGFARSCGVEVEDLDKLETDKGSWLVFRSQQTGQAAQTLIPDIVKTALDKLPIPKRMRWGDLEAQFVRPVHWAIMLFGDKIIDADILGVATGRSSRGHRFHYPQPITVPVPSEYEVLLESEGKVIADFERRRETVRAQVEQAALSHNAHAVIDDDLLDEVTSMVEWPMALTGKFEKRFLAVPAEALISTMKANQKYFHLVDKQHKLLPYFITISNIESRDINMVREGNERVIRPRFADAEFFWNQDRKTRLDQRLATLKTVVFQKQLGSLYDKTQRIAKLAGYIAEQIGGDKLCAMRAAELCKCDLMTQMVGEFPNLQGIMGRYYAEQDGEEPLVAQALDDYYKPRFAGDQLPTDVIGQAVALADRVDTLIGIFWIREVPSGSKDPYALRRAALGVLRIIIEKELPLDLNELLRRSLNNYKEPYNDKGLSYPHEVASVIPALEHFIMERLRVYYTDMGVAYDTIDAVMELKPTAPVDIDKRLWAVNHFRELPEAQSLAAANKRIGNILKQVDGTLPDQVDDKLFQEDAETTLYKALNKLKKNVAPLLKKADYQTTLSKLAALRAPVDNYFDHVMVMVDNDIQRNNRIALLNNLHKLFIQIADISRLQG